MPTSFAVKAAGTVMSGRLRSQQVDVGGFVKFRKVFLDVADPVEITRVTDSEGHRYYEVDHLAQEVVFKAIINNNADRNSAPSILKAIPVTRRFTLEKTVGSAYLQFGYGSEKELTNESVVDPSKIVLKLHGRDYVTQPDFDPTNLTSTDKFGVGPSNTRLTIVYRMNDASDVNVAAKKLTNVGIPLFAFKNSTSLNAAKLRAVQNSLEVSNTEPIVGNISIPSADELKQRVYGHFAAQNRAVTLEDYKAISYAMPPSFGGIHRCGFERDFNSFKRNLNMFVISKAPKGFLETTNSTVKQNLKIWLANYKMVNDTIDIRDGRVVNFGINFTIVADYEENRFNVVNLATQRLRNVYSRRQFDLGESLQIVDIYKELHRVPGVVDVLDVAILHRQGNPYSESSFDFNAAMSVDGRYISAPLDVIFELKFPGADIQGSVT
jgi:hypothetical protein